MKDKIRIKMKKKKEIKYYVQKDEGFLDGHHLLICFGINSIIFFIISYFLFSSVKLTNIYEYIGIFSLTIFIFVIILFCVIVIYYLLFAPRYIVIEK